MRVETARAEHYERIGSICVEAYDAAGHFASWGEDPRTDQDGYAVELRDVAGRAAQGVVLVALDGDEVVGTLSIARPGTPHAEIARPGELELRMLAVAGTHRGRGIAGALFDEAAERGREAGAEALVLMSIEPPEAVRRRYSSRGYVRVPERDGHWDEEGVARGEVTPYPVWRLDITAAAPAGG